jgi:hypothetical protein
VPQAAKDTAATTATQTPRSKRIPSTLLRILPLRPCRLSSLLAVAETHRWRSACFIARHCRVRHSWRPPRHHGEPPRDPPFNADNRSLKSGFVAICVTPHRSDLGDHLPRGLEDALRAEPLPERTVEGAVVPRSSPQRARHEVASHLCSLHRPRGRGFFAPRDLLPIDAVADEPAFPFPKKRDESPYRTAPPGAPGEPRKREDVTPPPSRRLGCVIPLAALGVALCAGGASIVHDWWSSGGTMSVMLLLLCVGGGPALIVGAIKVYRDPDF